MQTFTSIPGLSEGELDTLNDLVAQLEAVRPRNRIRDRYHDSKQSVRQLGIAVPRSMDRLETVVGWPNKALQVLNRRLRLDGFVVPGQMDAFGLSQIAAENALELEAPQMHTSAMKYATSFILVSAGDQQSGEPEILWTPKSGMHATALWDSRRRQVRAALFINEEGADGEGITKFTLALPDRIVTSIKSKWNTWTSYKFPHGLGRVPVAVLPYQPELDRPFGRSRISRAVMSLTDQAVRSILRGEVGAEFFAAPQRYLLGADDEAFVGADGSVKTGWEVTVGRLLAISRDAEGNLPEVGQFAQMSMQPHMDQLRSIAMLFAGETDMSVSSLGIIHDNPASAEAMHSANLDLVLNAEATQVTFGHGWLDAARMSVMMREGWYKPTAELLGTRAKWRDASTPTKMSMSQYVMSQVQGGVLPASSAVTLEQLGYDQTTIERIMADRRREEASSRLGELVSAVQQIRQPAAITAGETIVEPEA